eukprot:CAMPEP_0169467688 /NCGR_PEP_ID=MMETSP1042-20121227/22483_1 /TAXON_ID=464988 /ORGANISM="Hemiselmis andersenii, Strain CCMP1180" /LENGTH=88 /DNA_ID=CAMNT_0009580921 /DNA_START=18 /DNA_END=280 /DNA_ORIENTATION=+
MVGASAETGSRREEPQSLHEATSRSTVPPPPPSSTSRRCLDFTQKPEKKSAVEVRVGIVRHPLAKRQTQLPWEGERQHRGNCQPSGCR